MILPNRLKRGDVVSLVAPAGKVKRDKFEKLIKIVEDLGLKPKYSDKVFGQYGYFSGTDEDRLEDLLSAFSDSSSKAVFCLRGGYGATRLLSKIPYSMIKKNPKIFLGFSDITALQMAFLKKIGLITFHTSLNALKHDYTKDLFYKMAFERNSLEIPFDTDFSPSPIVINHGKASGQLVGGNLSLLVSLIGTGFLPSFKKKVVFIEEIHEPPYKIDRMLNHLFMATDISKAAGVILGIFNGCEWNNFYDSQQEAFSLIEIFNGFFKQIKAPVVYKFPLGHIDKMAVLPMGSHVYFDTDSLIVKVLKPVVK